MRKKICYILILARKKSAKGEIRTVHQKRKVAGICYKIKRALAQRAAQKKHEPEKKWLYRKYRYGQTDRYDKRLKELLLRTVQ